MSDHESVIQSDPDIMSGTPVFRGTRVPAQTLLDFLRAGDSIDEFLEGFPTVSREQGLGFLEQVRERVINPTKAA